MGIERDPADIAADALVVLANAAEQIAANGRSVAGMMKTPLLSERDHIRAHAWLHIYGAALNCLGVNSADARNAADKGLRFYEERFLKE